MITLNRTASIAPGKTGDALAFSQQIVRHIKEKYGTTAEVLMPIGGNPQRIAWQVRYENLTQYEALATKLMTGKEYWELASKNSATFLPGSLHDDLWRTI
jgi:hypothetical protein